MELILEGAGLLLRTAPDPKSAMTRLPHTTGTNEMSSELTAGLDPLYQGLECNISLYLST